MENILVYGYLTSKKRRRQDDTKRENDQEKGTNDTKKKKIENESESKESESGIEKSYHMNGTFGRMKRPDGSTVVIDTKVVRHYSRPKKESQEKQLSPMYESDEEEESTQRAYNEWREMMEEMNEK